MSERTCKRRACTSLERIFYRFLCRTRPGQIPKFRHRLRFLPPTKRCNFRIGLLAWISELLARLLGRPIPSRLGAVGGPRASRSFARRITEGRCRDGAGLRTQKGRNHVPGDGHLVERIRESPLLVAHEIGDGSPGRLLRSENLLKGRGPERGIQRNDPAAARSGLLQASWQYITWRAMQAYDPAKTAAEHWRSRASRASSDRSWSGTSRTGSA